jgi:hypothetical protein
MQVVEVVEQKLIAVNHINKDQVDQEVVEQEVKEQILKLI